MGFAVTQSDATPKLLLGLLVGLGGFAVTQSDATPKPYSTRAPFLSTLTGFGVASLWVTAKQGRAKPDRPLVLE